MKTIIFALTLLVTSLSHAGFRVLDCATPAGLKFLMHGSPTKKNPVEVTYFAAKKNFHLVESTIFYDESKLQVEMTDGAVGLIVSTYSISVTGKLDERGVFQGIGTVQKSVINKAMPLPVRSAPLVIKCEAFITSEN
ncbi:MAG: hypothetical protein V4736_03110 [Bdellovibrionota bacterium]